MPGEPRGYFRPVPGTNPVVERAHPFPVVERAHPTNPVDFSTFDSLTVPADSSAAAELQAALPGAKVVKAFNTNFAATLFSGEVGGVPTTVVIAGDDDGAKARLTELVSAGGVSTADAGSLKRARELEALGFLQLVLAVREQVAWTGGFAVRS